MSSVSADFGEPREASNRLIVIENPILNTPFEEHQRHFRFTEDGISNEILQQRRSPAYFIPVPKPRKRGQSTAPTRY
jgi:type III restriction enzyme